MDADGGSARAKTKLATRQERFADSYKAELDAFRTILRTGKVDSALTSLADGLKVQQIGAAAKISARNGKPYILKMMIYKVSDIMYCIG